MFSTGDNKMYYIAIIMVFIIFACSFTTVIYVSSKEKAVEQNLIDVQHKIAIIDGCEYILIGNKSVWIHKGNCNNPVHQKETK